MKCIRCGKVLLGKPGAVVPSSHVGEPFAWGPKCAVIAGLHKPKRRIFTVKIKRRDPKEPGQIDWVNDL